MRGRWWRSRAAGDGGQFIATSGYRKWVSMATSTRNAGFDDEGAFLDHVFATGTRFAEMVEAAR